MEWRSSWAGPSLDVIHHTMGVTEDSGAESQWNRSQAWGGSIHCRIGVWGGSEARAEPEGIAINPKESGRAGMMHKGQGGEAE